MPEKRIDSIEEIEIRDQALSETANSEMTNREQWNQKNPPT